MSTIVARSSTLVRIFQTECEQKSFTITKVQTLLLQAQVKYPKNKGHMVQDMHVLGSIN